VTSRSASRHVADAGSRPPHRLPLVLVYGAEALDALDQFLSS